jgi:leucine-zipper of insertion element IS481
MSTQRTRIARWPPHVRDRHADKITTYGSSTRTPLHAEALVSHRNARLTVHGRRLIVERVLSRGRPRANVAAETGVSRQCVSHWIGRFLTEGETGLDDRSSRPQTSPAIPLPRSKRRW